MRIKLAALLAFVLFVALAGGGVAQAYWLSQVSTSSKVQVASLDKNCTPATKLGNGSFESPVIAASSYWQGAVPSWLTTDARGIEVWSSGFNGVPAQVGNQFVELNAESAGTLWQEIATTPGQTIRWSLLHRAREGVDTMRVSLGPVGASGVSQGTYSATTSSWVRHEGTYTVPTGQAITRFSMTAVSTGSGNPTIGNFIDDVSFGSGPCLVPTAIVTNLTRSLSSTQVGDVLSYSTTVKNTGGSQALTSTLLAVLPAGIEYQPNTLKVDGTVQSGTFPNDRGGYIAATRTLSTRLGLGANATAGGSIAPDQIMTVTFSAVATAVGLGSSVDVIPSAGYTDYLAPLWPQTAISTPASFTVIAADLAVAVTGTPTVTVGSSATWTFSLTNNGPSSAAGVNVAVSVPTGVTPATVTGTTANNGTGSTSCTGTGTPRTCSFGTLGSGDTRTITLSGTVSTAQTEYASTATASATTYDHIATNNAVTGTVTVPDTQAPSTPTGLSATGTTTNRTTIKWTASTDNVGVAGYDVYRNGVRVNTTTGLTFTDTGLDSGTRFVYTVVAYDAALNRSASAAAQVVFTTIDPAHWYRISYGAKCVGTTSTSDDTGLKIVDCAATTLQQWRFVASSKSGYYSVVPLYNNNNRMWDIANGMAQVSSVDDDENDQRWRPIVTTLNGTSYLGFQNRAGSCLDAPGSTTTSGAQFQQFACNASPAQSFLLTKVP